MGGMQTFYSQGFSDFRVGMYVEVEGSRSYEIQGSEDLEKSRTEPPVSTPFRQVLLNGRSRNM